MNVILCCFYFVLGAFLRRWFGGAFPEDKYKVMGNRGLQTVVMMLVLATCYWQLPFKHWEDFLSVTLIVCWIQFQFWSRGHGCCFDIGRGVFPPEESVIKRYNERWYHFPCDWLFDKLVKRSDRKYGFLYDFIYMGLRYTCPMLALSLMLWVLSFWDLANSDFRYVWLGLVVAPIYAFNWTLYEREEWIRPRQSWLNIPTKWSEIIVGGIVYAGCYLLGR